MTAMTGVVVMVEILFRGYRRAAIDYNHLAQFGLRWQCLERSNG
jgi:hypothetical protein